MDNKKVERMHSFERFANAAFDARNSFILQLHQLAYENGYGWDLVRVYLNSAFDDPDELIDWVKETDFKIGD